MNSEISLDSKAATIDAEHLRLLSLGHYIVGGFCILFFSMFIFHFVLSITGAWDMTPPSGGPHHPNSFPKNPNLIFAVFSGMAVVGGWALGGLVILTGKWIKHRVRHLATIVVACICIAVVPFGTILGVFTLLVLLRPSVKRLYEH